MFIFYFRFTLDDKMTQISVAAYFQDKYKIKLRYVTWPALQAGNAAKPIYLPMEVPIIVSITFFFAC